MEENLDKENKDGIKRDQNGRFIEGTEPGPGRPPYKSLKEWWKQRLALMTDEERKEFSRTVSKDQIWKMAEGNPPQHHTIDGELKLPFTIIVEKDGGTTTTNPTSEAV